MAQGVLPFKYESEKKTTGMTAPAGLPVYLDLTRVIGLSKSIEKHLKKRKGGQGWTDSIDYNINIFRIQTDFFEIIQGDIHIFSDAGVN